MDTEIKVLLLLSLQYSSNRNTETLLPLQNRLGTLDWQRIKEALAGLRMLNLEFA
jgi:hypothetical protein